MITIYDLRSTIRRGFTLIELLVVIAIIGILSSLSFTNLVSARERARAARRKADLSAISQALRLYYNDNQSFPLGTSGRLGPNACGSSGCAWGSAFTNGGTTTYMNILPLDPSSTTSNSIPYVYTSAGGDTYTLTATLENGSDPDIATSQARCNGSGTNVYYVCQ